MNRMMTKRNVFLFVLIACLGMAIAIAGWSWNQSQDKHPLITKQQFTEIEIGNTFALFDLGVTDINNDSFLDIFSTNHNGRQLLLFNQAGKTFKDQAIQTFFPQNYEIAEIKTNPQLPVIQEPGLYVYWNNNELTIESKGLITGQTEKIGGSLLVPKSASHQSTGKIQFNEDGGQEGFLGRIIGFQIQGDGQFKTKFLTSEPYFRPALKISSALSLDQIYIGANKEHPTIHDFYLPPLNALPYMDRHGMAWTDYNQDGRPDVLIVRGGMDGLMPEISPQTQDEFFIQSAAGFEDKMAKFGWIKAGCAARQITWVDFNRDNYLDAYVVCGRGVPPGSLQPNQLYQGSAQHTFTNVAKQVKLDFLDNGLAKWFDADNDGDMDLFWVDSQSFWLYRNQSGRFTPESLGALKSGVRQIAVADYDLDGDFDVFAASSENRLFVNTNGQFSAAKIADLGLPRKSIAANWVDYDNDGLLDLFLLPDGLYQQTTDHRFKSTKLLKTSSDKFPHSAYSTWFDVDNNGSLDLLMGKQTVIPWWEAWELSGKDLNPVSKSYKAKVFLYRNQPTNHHWLDVQLVGSQGDNTPAVGAIVKLLVNGVVYQQEVGQFEGSIRSQGHYRLYFGLGKQKEIDALQITWPNGQLQEIKNPGIDQLLTVKQTIKQS